MKPLSLALVLLVAVGVAGCQRQAAPERAASAPSPSPTATPAAPAEAAPMAAAAPTPHPPARAETSSRSARIEPAPEPTPLVPPALVPGPVTPPTPTPTPPPPPPRIVHAGAVLPVVLKQTVSTETANPEDRVVAELAEPVVENGDVLLPAGAEVLGHVVTSVRSGRVKGRAHLVVAFDQIRTEGRTFDIEAARFDVTAKSSKGRDAKIAGGAAAAGAIIGAIAGGGSGALKGGAIGGAAGGATVLATRGYEVELPAGSHYKLELKRSIRLN
jgi:hypothetical protein